MEKRIKVKLKKPNPLFRSWLKEWIDEAEKKKKKISKTYQKALNSLEKYPLSLYSGHDCSILEGFGTKICDMLEEKLQEHLKTHFDLDQNLCFKDKIEEIKRREYDELIDLINNLEAEQLIDNTIEAKSMNLSVIDEGDDEEKIESDNQENVEPMDLENSDDSLDMIIKKYQPTKSKEIHKADTLLSQQSPISTFQKPKGTLRKFKSFNTNLAGPSYASSPISRVTSTSSPIKRLTSIVDDDDDELNAIVNKYTSVSPPPNVEECFSPIITPKKKRRVEIPTDKILSPPKVVEVADEKKEEENDFKYITVDDINPHDYEVILIIDIGEAKSKTNCEIQTKIAKLDVRSQVEKLHIGDFVWIAVHKTDKSKKYVLPYIIERKRLDDLASSIKSDRFHEQKFRLRLCGIENVIYLIENLKATAHGLPFETLTQAISNTFIQNKFQVKITDDKDHTVLYLALMSNFIAGIFYNKKPIKFKLLEFETFNKSSVKQRKCTVRETFVKQLLTLKGVSVDMALDIVKYFPTPSHLYEKYYSLKKSDGENLLNKITIGDIKRKIPASVSKIIYNFYIHQK